MTHTYVQVPAALLAQGITAYDEAGMEAKKAFHRAGKAFLTGIAKALGLGSSLYDLRSNAGGMAVSGEVTLHTDELYLQLSESCTKPGISLMYRSCTSRKDYCGHRNHFISAQDLRQKDRQADFMRTLESLRCDEARRRLAEPLTATN